MFAKSLLVCAAAVALAGCAASVEPVGETSSRNSVRVDETAQLAAYAATAYLPENANVRSGMEAAAIVHRDGSIAIYNFSNQPLVGGNIWVNRTFVQHFDTIPAMGYTILPRGRFYDRRGVNLMDSNERVQSVLLQQDRDVYALEGPVFQ